MKKLISLFVGVVLVLSGAAVVILWTTCRIYVPENKCAVLIRKMGDPLPAGQQVATEPTQRGIQADVLGPGRYFYNPIVWDWQIHDLTVIPSGDPQTWSWIHSLDVSQRDELRAGNFKFEGEFPMIGLVTRKIGKPAPAGQNVVSRESGMKGVLREVLTPGTYKINPLVYEVEVMPAVVIPAGFVGVVTNQQGEIAAQAPMPKVAPDTDAEHTPITHRPLAEAGQRGIQRNVLQPGIYFVNPWLQKVTLIEIGFNEYSQVRISDSQNFRIPFPSDTGYTIRVGVTVVWGIDPKYAASVINEFGNIDTVIDKVIAPQLRSICRNIGSTYAARDFIQGEKRELFQRDMTEELQRVCRQKNIEVLLALVRDVEVLSPASGAQGDEVTEDLKRTIQQSFIAVEKQLTYEKQRDAAAKKAELEEMKKKVDIARETISADTRVQVANIKAEGEKQAAEIEAQAQLEVATIQEKVAKLEAQRVEILGTARTDVEKMKKQAEADGYKLLVDAFGSAQAYNLYTFAQNFEPQSIRLFFAGEGTFWTDLSRFEEVGAAKILQETSSGTQ